MICPVYWSRIGLLYADDLKIFRSIQDERDCDCLQSDLDKLHDWCILHGMVMNVAKCAIMTYSSKREIRQCAYKLGGVALQRLTEIKDLGVWFDAGLNFGVHIRKLTADALRSLGFVTRNSLEFMNLDTVKTLYFAFVRSKLEYCNAVWSPSSVCYIVSLEKVQRRFVKYLHYLDHGWYPPRGNWHYETLLTRYGLTSLEERRIGAAVDLVRGLVSGSVVAPELLSYLNFRVPRMSARSDMLFTCHRANTNLGLNSPINRAMRCCNNSSEFHMFI